MPIFSWSIFVFGSTAMEMTRVGEGMRLKEDRVILVAERVAGGDVLDAHDRGDVARVAGVDVLALVRLDLDEAADALALVRARDCKRCRPWSACHGIAHRKNTSLSDERIAPELEGQRAERSRCRPRTARIVSDTLSGFSPLAGLNVERVPADDR